MNFGVIGYGYRGPNIVRNLSSLEGVKVHAVADLAVTARERASADHSLPVCGWGKKSKSCTKEILS
jgi:predicted homoserine dehydrogenase-like protein